MSRRNRGKAPASSTLRESEKEGLSLSNEVRKAAANKLGTLVVIWVVGCISGASAFFWSAGGYKIGLRPSKQDLSGCWEVSLPPYRGQVELQQKGKTVLSGRFSLGETKGSDTVQGVIYSNRDSNAASLDFIWPPYDEHWNFQGKIDGDTQSMQIRGDATQFVDQGRGDNPKPGESAKFLLTSGRSLGLTKCGF